MQRSVWGMAAISAISAASFGYSAVLNGAVKKISCASMHTKPFERQRIPVAGIGVMSEGQGGQLLVPFLSFDRASKFAGTYQAMLWDRQNWKPLSVGGFEGTNGVLQFVNLKGTWYGFSNVAKAAGSAQLPTLFVGNSRGVFAKPQVIDVFSAWGEFDSAAKGQREDRIGITGRDRMGGGFTSVFAEKIGNGRWLAEPLLLDGHPTPEGFSTMIGYDQGDSPWLAYESQPGGARNEAGVVTKTSQGWSLIPVSPHHPANLVGAYLPPSRESGHERIALVWTEKNGSVYNIQASVLDLRTRRLSRIQTLAVGIIGQYAAPLPAITVAHDGMRASVSLMSSETHQGWVGTFADGAFGALREYVVPAGQGVWGFPQTFYSACDDSAQLLVGVGAKSLASSTFDLSATLRIQAL